ncbi:MAG: hypothetical protein ABUK01_07635 [Leptospirales bacterium]
MALKPPEICDAKIQSITLHKTNLILVGTTVYEYIVIIGQLNEK